MQRFIYILTSLTITLLLCSVNLSAQTTRSEMLADPLKCAGVYMPYPQTVDSPTPVPRGYTPFYVSHYGRHGSRYLINESDYTDILNLFTAAADEGILTPEGNDVLRRLQAIYAEAAGRAGELAPLGYLQHRQIASRLLKECAPAFRNNATVNAMSTTRMRCAHSMFAFTDQLARTILGVEITHESSERNMPFLSYNNPQAQAFNSTSNAPWNLKLNHFRQEQTTPGRLINVLFTDPQAATNIMTANDIMWKLYWVAIDQPNMMCTETLLDIFTPEELFNLWQVFNYEFYTRNSCNPENNGVFLESAKSLLSNILDNANLYIDNGMHGATLRFGHDSTIIPLAALLQIPIARGRETDPDKLYLTYADYRVSPMASNFQMRLYRNKKGSIIAKFMLNEQEVPLPDTPTDIFPYYRWDDVNNTIKRIITSPVK